MAETSIEWTDATWNPVAGCTVLTAGCTNCYAMRMAARLEAMGTAKYRGLTRKSGGRAVWTGKIRLDDTSLDIPETWPKPRKVFVNSMSDLFHDDVPIEFIARVWDVMKGTPRHTSWPNQHSKSSGTYGLAPALRTVAFCIGWTLFDGCLLQSDLFHLSR
jgi:protein gp37